MFIFRNSASTLLQPIRFALRRKLSMCKNSEMMMNPWCGIKGPNVTLPLSYPSPAFVREFMVKLAPWFLLRRMSSRIFPPGSWSSWLCFAKISAARRGYSQIAGKVGRNDPCNFSCAACTDPFDSAFWHNVAKRISCTHLLQSVEPIAWYTITGCKDNSKAYLEPDKSWQIRSSHSRASRRVVPNQPLSRSQRFQHWLSTEPWEQPRQ